MRYHHTKTDGDIGVACVIADLAKKGIGVTLPVSEHLPFDMVAVSPDGQFSRLSVKFRRAKHGSVRFEFKSVWNDRHGTHIVVHDRSWYDAIAVYCPDTNACYYIRREQIAGVTLSFRIGETANRQKTRVRFAHEYVDPWTIFPRPVSGAVRAPPSPPASAPTTGAPGRGARRGRARAPRPTA